MLFSLFIHFTKTDTFGSIIYQATDPCRPDVTAVLPMAGKKKYSGPLEMKSGTL